MMCNRMINFGVSSTVYATLSLIFRVQGRRWVALTVMNTCGTMFPCASLACGC
jgi:hypothetical protein